MVTLPGEPEEYVHRVGRTARAGAKGQAVLLLRESEVGYVDLLTGLGVAVQQLHRVEVLKQLPNVG